GVMREARFMKTHVFPFSPRRGTPAAEMRDRVMSREIRLRVAAADKEGRRLAREFARSRIGRRAEVLVESRRERGLLTGFSGRYVRVFLEGPDDLVGRVVPMRITALTTGGVLGEVIA
ncbi:MAG: tRNA (N(6)-L-threonylcarbamoyladenosine(37)-C(2))-methylthiotransferase MtaB, partial [Planctomycetota bacterium]